MPMQLILATRTIKTLNACVCHTQREKRQQELLNADGDFYLPINHRADDPLETAGIDISTVDTAIAADNKGYQMLQKMGWGGKGLGRKENGAQLCDSKHVWKT